MDSDLAQVRIVSLDAEGTLASHSFSHVIWQEVIPALYGERHGLELDSAAQRVFAEYADIGPGRPEWYDIEYWFRRLELGDPAPVLERHRSLIEFYPEVVPVLQAVHGKYTLVVASSTPREFLRPLLRDVEHCFTHMFSSTSLCGRLKDAEFFRWMCQQMRVEPSEVLHVGDHLQRDYISARDAGMRSLRLDRTGQSPTALSNLTGLLEHLGLSGEEQEQGIFSGPT